MGGGERTSRDIWSGGPVGGVMSELNTNIQGPYIDSNTRRHSQTEFDLENGALAVPSTRCSARQRVVHFRPSGLGAPLSDTQTSRAPDTNKDD